MVLVSCAAYIASLCMLVIITLLMPSTTKLLLLHDIAMVESLIATSVSLRVLSGKLESHVFLSLLGTSSVANKAHLISSYSLDSYGTFHWLWSSLGRHSRFQVVIKWWQFSAIGLHGNRDTYSNQLLVLLVICHVLCGILQPCMAAAPTTWLASPRMAGFIGEVMVTLIKCRWLSSLTG